MHHWAAVLAGGEGTRVQALTEHISGDRRPKQFCRLLNSQTLLAATRTRLSRAAPPHHTVCVVTRHHETYYRDEFADTAPHLVIEQPANRGTAVAIVFALARIARLDPSAVVGVFPSDHHYDNEAIFQEALAGAYALASAENSRVVLLGAQPNRPETEYGWIARGDSTSMTLSFGHAVDVVAGFHEKPDPAQAADLFARGALWNTFVMVGHLSAFVALVTSVAPLLRSTFEWLRRAAGPAEERAEAETLYSTLSSMDFSRDVLTHDPTRLLVLTLPEAGWTDLGHASRIQAVLAQGGNRQVGLVVS